jgi:hypothetical protein
LFIDDLASARRAIDIIVHQGEGLADHHWADPARQELTHYAKLLRMADGYGSIGPIRPLPIDPRTAGYPEHARSPVILFNAVYRALFHVLDALYRPGGSQGALVGVLYLLMTEVMGQLARHITAIPAGDGAVCGPTFEFVDLGREPVASLVALATGAAVTDPDLAGVVAPLLEPDSLAALR